MNLSGRSVRAFSQFYKLAAEQTLIVYDDLALPLGQLRLRREGSSGGQNGMQSVIEQSLQANDLTRTRFRTKHRHTKR